MIINVYCSVYKWKAFWILWDLIFVHINRSKCVTLCLYQSNHSTIFQFHTTFVQTTLQASDRTPSKLPRLHLLLALRDTKSIQLLLRTGGMLRHGCEPSVNDTPWMYQGWWIPWSLFREVCWWPATIGNKSWTTGREISEMFPVSGQKYTPK